MPNLNENPYNALESTRRYSIFISTLNLKKVRDELKQLSSQGRNRLKTFLLGEIKNMSKGGEHDEYFAYKLKQTQEIQKASADLIKKHIKGMRRWMDERLIDLRITLLAFEKDIPEPNSPKKFKSDDFLTKKVQEPNVTPDIITDLASENRTFRIITGSNPITYSKILF